MRDYDASRNLLDLNIISFEIVLLDEAGSALDDDKGPLSRLAALSKREHSLIFPLTLVRNFNLYKD